MPLEYRTNYIRSVYSLGYGSAKVLAYIRMGVCMLRMYVYSRHEGTPAFTVGRTMPEPRQNGVSRLFVIRTPAYSVLIRPGEDFGRERTRDETL